MSKSSTVRAVSLETTETRTRTRDIKQDTYIIRRQNKDLKDDTTTILTAIKALEGKLAELGVYDKPQGIMLRRFLDRATESIIGSDESAHTTEYDVMSFKSDPRGDIKSDSGFEEALPINISEMPSTETIMNPRMAASVSAGQWARARLTAVEQIRYDKLLFRSASEASCRVRVLENLLLKGADFNCLGELPPMTSSNHPGVRRIFTGSVLMMLCCRNNLDAVELILDWGADINKLASSRHTALHFASGLGFDSIVRELLSRGAGAGFKQTPWGKSKSDQLWSPLEQAIYSENPKCIQLFLDYRAPDDAWSIKLSSIVKMKVGCLEAVLKSPGCLKYDFRSDLERDYTESIICAAEKEASLPHLKLLIHCASSWKATQWKKTRAGFLTAAALGNTAGLATLGNLHKIRDAVASHHPLISRALCLAARNEHEGCISQLGLFGIHKVINRVSPTMDTPLTSAVVSGNQNCVAAILKLGANINGPQGPCGSPLQTAVCIGNKPLVKFLLNNGADPDIHRGCSSHDDSHALYSMVRSYCTTEEYQKIKKEICRC